MLRVAVLCLAIGSGLPLPAVAVMAAALWQPMLLLVAIPCWLLLHRHRQRAEWPDADDEARFLRSLASELAGGASLRGALAVAADRAPRLELDSAARMATSGLPAHRVADSLAASLPVNGRLAGAAWLLAARSGGPAVAVAHDLAALAAEEGALRRERRSLTAQARASAWVVAALPAVLLAAMFGGGRLSVDDPALVPILAIGLTLQAAGVAVVVWMLRRAEQ